MRSNFLSRKMVLGLLMMLLLLTPVLGMAETMVMDRNQYFAANDDLYFWFDPADYADNADVYEYLTTHFIRDWDDNGEIEISDLNDKVAVEWSGLPENSDCEEEFGYYVERICAYVDCATEENDGLQVTLTLTNVDNGNEFVVRFTALFSGLVSEPITIETEGEIGEEIWGQYVDLKIGETAEFTINHHYDGAQPCTIHYEWYTNDENDELVLLPATGKTYLFTMERELSYLGCNVYLKDENGAVIVMAEVNPVWFYIPFPEITLDVVSSHKVVNNVLTATEGDTVTIDLNPTCEDPNAYMEYTWFLVIYDDEGYGIDWVDLPHDGESICFVATADMNGWILYGEAYGTGLNSNPIEYTLVVLPEGAQPDEELKMDIKEGLTADSLSDELKADPELNTPEKVEADITIKLLAQATAEGVNAAPEQTAVYEVTLMVSTDGGQSFVEATKENWPESGRLTVTLPYPEGTGKDTHTFVAAHMFTQSNGTHKAGDIEYPAVTNTANGIQFEVTGLSPIAVAWAATNAAPNVPATGDSAMPYLWLVGMLASAAGVIVLAGKRRTNA